MKHLCYLLVSMCTVLLSCTEEAIAPNVRADERARQVLSIPRFSERKLAYSLLEGQEKVAFWKIHITQVSQKMNLNPEQLEAIDETFAFITADNLSKHADNEALRKWESVISKQFDVPTRIRLFGNIDAPSPNVVGPRVCECSRTQDFCGRHNDHWVNTIYTCQPVTPACTNTESGCGYFFLYACTGICKLLKE